jgi:diguanylate cyclase (GGDEF)-like protein
MDMVKDTQTLIAQIDFTRGYSARALATLNEAFDQSGMSPRRVAKVFKLRARTNAALHRYRDAYDDLDKYIQRYEAVNEAERARQATALRARFETDRALERAASLKRELGLAQELADRREEQLRWTIILTVTSALVIALLVYILFANLRHRRQLVQLASQDALTGLPNRRSTAELATGALRAAFAAQTPLTLAVIDLDRFKAINDQCGHATGDYVLKEFARRCRESLRTHDIFGRWGGEEFLLVMPATSLDMGLAVMGRLREVALEIRLPQQCAGMRVSLSAGLALIDDHTKSLDELIASADRALYEAKEQGRDLVRVADTAHRAGISGVWRAMGGDARDGSSARAHTLSEQ